MAARKLPKGIRKKSNGGYEARAQIRGEKIYLYGSDLDLLIEEFEEAKEKASRTASYKKENYTLNDWFNEWFMDVKSHKIKETSIAPMRNSYKRTFGFYIGTMKLRDITPMDVQRALNAMEKEGVSSRTMRDTLGRLRECMEFAVANQIIPVNPCLIVEVPWTFKRVKKEVALTQEEQNQFLNSVEETWYKEMFYFMCLTGVRVGELGGLKWSDIDFEKKEIHIERALSCNYCDGVKREMLVSPKTVNSTRTIPFIGEMEVILLSQKKKQKLLKKELGARWRSTGELDGLVFTTTMGSPCTRYIVEKEIKKAIRRMENDEAYRAVQEGREPKQITNFHPHSLRHTFATRCFENKMEPKVVQQLMGHSSISVTLNIYTHVLDTVMKDEISKFGTANTMMTELEKITVPEITAMSHR
ncbi:MAG: tyrosine-type recombinase/integrase [Bacillota bacterium]|nr:tyrosine-type recombinase/integrase [Bacillota bacterium]